MDKKKRFTVSQAARAAGVSDEEIRCAVVDGRLMGEVSENTGMYMISGASLDVYIKAHNHTRQDDERRRVLVIDDEINFGNLVKLDLQRDRRIIAKFASWGGDGIRLAKEFRPHVIMLDFMLADTTGERVLEELQELCRECSTKVLVYSANIEDLFRSDENLRERLERLGASGFVSKTIGLRMLVRRVQNALGLEALTERPK